MNLSRRDFLKSTATFLAAVGMPAIARPLSLFEDPKVQDVELTIVGVDFQPRKITRPGITFISGRPRPPRPGVITNEEINSLLYGPAPPRRPVEAWVASFPKFEIYPASVIMGVKMDGLIEGRPVYFPFICDYLK